MEKPSSVAGTAQFGGQHYKGLAIEPVEYAHRNGLGFLAGSVVKYISRHHLRGSGPEDTKKAIHFCVMLLDMEYGIKVDMEEVKKLLEADNTTKLALPEMNRREIEDVRSALQEAYLFLDDHTQELNPPPEPGKPCPACDVKKKVMKAMSAIGMSLPKRGSPKIQL